MSVRTYDGTKIKTYPEGARQASEDAALKAGLLALGRHTFVDTLLQPDIRLDVPVVEQDLEVLRELNLANVNVCRAVPRRAPLRGEACEAEASNN